GAKDIHAVVLDHGLDETRSRRVLKAYFSVWNAVSEVSSMQHNAAPSSAARSALFGKPGASLMGVFGGQLGSATYLDEARWLLDVYAPLVSDFVAQMTAFLCHEAQDSRMSSAYFKGINVLQWLTHAESTPNEQYLLSMPVCLPLLGLVQLMQVMILYKTLGISPGELVVRFKVVTGHSQGIAVATAFSMLTDEQSFYNIARKILGIQMLTGVLPQAEFPCFKLIQCTNGSRPEPTSSEPRPMVAVQGVSRQVLEAIICKFNSGQPSPKHHMHMAVINTADQFIVAGHIESATLFIQFVRARSARSSDNQSRIPMSQRKPLIIVHYLGITAPYHSPLLSDMAREILEIVRKKQWVLEGSDLKIAVRATEDGHDIRSEHDLTKYLVESMCKLPVDWPRAVNHVGISHIVDFGAGGFGGFGKLAFKNLEGRGIPVVCAGALVPRRSQPQMGAKADLYRSK
ncbi:fatty acid synthase alpha subunit Lsd1, partial [Kickxella alabastrina]